MWHDCNIDCKEVELVCQNIGQWYPLDNRIKVIVALMVFEVSSGLRILTKKRKFMSKKGSFL